VARLRRCDESVDDDRDKNEEQCRENGDHRLSDDPEYDRRLFEQRLRLMIGEEASLGGFQPYESGDPNRQKADERVQEESARGERAVGTAYPGRYEQGNRPYEETDRHRGDEAEVVVPRRLHEVAEVVVVS